MSDPLRDAQTAYDNRAPNYGRDCKGCLQADLYTALEGDIKEALVDMLRGKGLPDLRVNHLIYVLFKDDVDKLASALADEFYDLPFWRGEHESCGLHSLMDYAEREDEDV